MMEQELITNTLRSSTKDVFSTMLGLEVECGESYTEMNAPGPSSGVISVIGLAGAWIGTASICCDTSMACRMASQMLGEEYGDINEEVLDVVSEITNMIIGSFKNAAETYLGPMGLSIPTVIYGLNFLARTAAKERCIVVPFNCGTDKVEVKLSLSPNRGLPRLDIVTSANAIS